MTINADRAAGQMAAASAELAKPMSGECSFYVDGKMIGSVCDDQLYMKPTASGRAPSGPASDAPP